MQGRNTYTGLRTGPTMLAGWLLTAMLFSAATLPGERLPDNGWQLLAVAYPDGRDVETILGGAEKTLTAKGLCKVKWRANAGTVEMKLEGLPAPSEAGWSDAQYVLWAVDNEKRTMNLGLVPTHGKNADWKFQVPFRIFGLLITAEKNPQAANPGPNVAMESRLPANPNLVVPVFRVKLALTP